MGVTMAVYRISRMIIIFQTPLKLFCGSMINGRESFEFFSWALILNIWLFSNCRPKYPILVERYNYKFMIRLAAVALL